MIMEIDDIYASNALLNEINSTLYNVQKNMSDYLSVNNTDSLGLYYTRIQNYTSIIEKLNNTVVNDTSLLLERNIRQISYSYMELTDKAVESKRGRNIEKYKSYYEESKTIYDYLTSSIYSLNNYRFAENSTNYQILSESLQYSEIMNVIVLGLVATASVILLILFAKSITQPLKRLVDSADFITNGNLDIELPLEEGNDEVSVLTKAFNQMVYHLRDYIVQIKVSAEHETQMKAKEVLMEAHLKEAELKYLQAQINPHFLFNTLNAGAQLAMLEGADRTYNYTQSVANFYRYNISKKQEIVTIKEELELIDNYLYIMNVRFQGDIQYTKDVDEKFLSVPLPIMSLQPIVENCMNYGIRNIDWPAQIMICVYQEDEEVCIAIRDNGIGMKKEKIEEIYRKAPQEKDNSETVGSNGIGLANVISRLELFYNKTDMIEITSEGENQGTEVAIFIPLEEKG